MYSKNVNDSFDIFITKADSLNPNVKYHAFYYLDAEINSGKLLRQMLGKPEYKNLLDSNIFIGIGQKGDYHSLRRRDFVVPLLENGMERDTSKYFGQSARFYSFLKYELMPLMNTKFLLNKNGNSIFGHSFGGLFVVYCLFKNDSLFNHYYALSPSLWVNNKAIYQYDNLQVDSSKKISLFLSAGSFETINLIKGGTDSLCHYLLLKKNNNLTVEYKIYQGASHNSQVVHSINDIFKNLMSKK